MDILFELILGFWVIIPAYTANCFAPIAKGKKRIDFGKKFIDGNHLLGKGKTWEGLAFAVFMGTLVGMVQIALYPYINPIALKEGFSLYELSFASVFFVSLGAMFGDMAGSFIKRRIDMKRGQPAPLLDQLDFVFGAFFFASFFIELTAVSVLLFVFITPIIHVIACIIGNRIGVKEVPW